MKTFSFEAKQEILNLRYDSFCCATSSLCAIFQTLGEIVFRGKALTVSLAIDHDDMFEFVTQTIEKFYGKMTEAAEIHITKRVGNERREWLIEPRLGEKLLFDTGLVSIENGSGTFVCFPSFKFIDVIIISSSSFTVHNGFIEILTSHAYPFFKETTGGSILISYLL